MNNVVKKGKKVKNPQTGLNIELPGKIIGSIQITETYGTTLNDELSIGEFQSKNGHVIKNDSLDDYYIEERLK